MLIFIVDFFLLELSVIEKGCGFVNFQSYHFFIFFWDCFVTVSKVNIHFECSVFLVNWNFYQDVLNLFYLPLK